MEKVFEVLEFNKIKEMILKQNINELSYQKVVELKPLFFQEVIQEELDKTKEAYTLNTLGTFPSLTLLKDLSNSLDCVHKNAIISLEKMYDFVNTLQTIENIKKYTQESKTIHEQCPYTLKYVNALNMIHDLLDQITYCVTPNFTLYDHASSKLKAIRLQIKKCETEIKEKMNEYLKKHASILSDNYIATRGNHYVLPVKASFKNQIKGIHIDTSSSSNTIFIEPYCVSECNALLEQLHYEEEIEIQRIIKALCDLINKYYNILLKNNEILKELSFMVLKGSFGLANNYEIATLNDLHQIKLKAAFHPLIPLNKVVSNDFNLGGNENNIIVISGPNAGGKTVALKTVGLIVLMNQCGLPIPVKSASLAVFRNIFVDIGDEQSIEQSLSGFSSHIKNVASILNHIDEQSLVIMDELGSKTDPYEGEALAKAIIEFLSEKNVIAMVSTHYLGIKDYAKESQQISIASMGFNEKDLSPTYQLILNTVGRSYALEIASRLGLDKKIIDKAKTYKSKNSLHLEGLIDELSKKLAVENNIISELKNKEENLNLKLQEVEKEKNQLQIHLNKALLEVEEEKEEMIAEATLKIQQIVEDFKQNSKQEGMKHHLKNQALDALNQMINANQDKTIESDILNVGDEVLIKEIQKKGKILEIKGNKCLVETSNTTLKLALNDLKKIDPIVIKQQKKNVKISNYEHLMKSIPLSLNLIGMHVEEALIALKNYLDGALLVRYEKVSIIHGYGTGALRKAVHEYLKTCKYVVDYHLGGFNEGGSGATVVILKVKK